MNWILIILMFLLAFFVRSVPIFFKKNCADDSYIHLEAIRQVKESKDIPKTFDRLILKEPFDYPPFSYAIFSLFPSKWLEKCGHYFSAFFDASNILILSCFCAIFNLDGWLFVFAALVYIFTPILINEASSFNPRSMGIFFFNIMFLFVFCFCSLGEPSLNWKGYVFIFGVCLMLMFTHMFATQTLYLTLLFFFFYTLNPVYLLAIPVLILLGTMLSGGYYLKILKSQLGIMQFWKNRKIGFNMKEQVSRLTGDKIQKQSFIGWLVKQQKEFGSNLGVPFVILIGLFVGGRALKPEFSFVCMLLCFVIFMFVIFLSTTYIKRIRHFGEGRRYLEYCSIPVAVLVAYFLNLDVWIVSIGCFLLLAINLLGTFIVYRNLFSDKYSKVDGSFLKLVDYLNKKEFKDKKAILVPYNNASAMVYMTKLKVLRLYSGTNLKKYETYYPIITEPLQKLVKRFDADLLIIDTNYIPLHKVKVKFKRMLNIDKYFIFSFHK